MNTMYVLCDDRENEIFGVATSQIGACSVIWDRMQEELEFEEWQELLEDLGYESEEDLQKDFFNGLMDGLDGYEYYEVPVYE